MNYIKTDIEGVYIIEPKVFGDNRGYFMETFSLREFESCVGPVNFVQDNESFSASKGVVRGLHFQKGEWSQAKLVRVASGAVLDIAVDLRKDSPTFGKHISAVLSDANKRMVYIPRGFAHGFSVLEDNTRFQYKCDNYYNPAAEGSFRWNDSFFGIDWMIPESEAILSAKDAMAPPFNILFI